jgi:hypothetical protein
MQPLVRSWIAEVRSNARQATALRGHPPSGL